VAWLGIDILSLKSLLRFSATAFLSRVFFLPAKRNDIPQSAMELVGWVGLASV
jgi:hypothetical protein